ncbi:ABC transporter permease [Archaeoglobus fulgidus]|jgi:putative ABC transport system permease protein|nr:ABC transporter permease [Archaeoglobus fulgidus]AIG98481.1 ABC-type transport system, involved in lipoprotein release, permease component [Archaeoglobus fulgidus DSM 8774]
MYIELAVRNLERARARSILAVVGIIIGVVAVASIGIFGNAMKQTVLERFEDQADTIVITPRYTEGYSGIEEDDFELIKRVERIEYAIAVKDERGEVEYEDRKAFLTVYGVDGDDLELLYDAYEGSIKLKGTAVVGYRLAEDFGLEVGDKISVEGKTFKVAAILEQQGMGGGINPDMAVFISMEDFDRLYDQEGYTSVIVEAESLEYIEAIEEEIDSTLNKKDEKVDIRDFESLIESVEESLNSMTQFLMAIAAVSLLVAGVSILNIMLMSTIERTKEIGVMRAIGAFRENIMMIFLLEALILGLTGSVFGAVMSVAGGYAIISMMGFSTAYVLHPSSALYIAEGFAVGVLTAVASGLYPAWKASKLEPIEALRYE